MVRIAICDDSDIQGQIIFDLLTEYAEIRKAEFDISRFMNGLRLIDDVEKNGAYQIYLLDQIMPFISGLELAEKLRAGDPLCQIVFISSDSEAVFEAFRVKAYGFLRKPIDVGKLYELLDRLCAEMETVPMKSFLFRTSGGDRKIPINEIRYIQKENRNLVCHLEDGSIVHGKSLRKSVKETVAPLLETGTFVMGGASMAINLKKVAAVSPEEVSFRDGEALHIPVRCWREIYDAWRRL